jgi:hypothetical protein
MNFSFIYSAYMTNPSDRATKPETLMMWPNSG